MNLNEKIIRFVKYSIKIINLVRKIAIYMEIGTIENIKTKIIEIREKIKVIDVSKYRNKVYGYEYEYTYPILIAEVRNILTDLTTLVSNPDIFVKLSTYNERKQIEDYLNNILYNLESSDLWSYVDSVKIILRNYKVRNFSEHRIEFEKEIDSIRRIKIDLENILRQSEKLEQNITTKASETS